MHMPVFLYSRFVDFTGILDCAVIQSRQITVILL